MHGIAKSSSAKVKGSGYTVFLVHKTAAEIINKLVDGFPHLDEIIVTRHVRGHHRELLPVVPAQ